MSEKPRVLLVEPDHKLAAELSRHLWSFPLVVDVSATAAGALLRMRDFAPDVVFAAVCEHLDGAELCRQIKRADPQRAVVLVFPPDEPRADALTEEAGADGWLTLPYNPGTVLSCVRWSMRLRQAARELHEARQAADKAALAPSPGTSLSDRAELEFFKRAMLNEVRRSQRYRFPLSLLCVEVDRFAETLGRRAMHLRSRAMGQLLDVIQDTVRDIDLAVLEGGKRFLVCLPQTDQDGARYVGERLRELLPKFADEPGLTVSIGLAAYDGSGGEVSFKGLYDQAASCLAHAQAEGGNRIEVVG